MDIAGRLAYAFVAALLLPWPDDAADGLECAHCGNSGGSGSGGSAGTSAREGTAWSATARGSAARGGAAAIACKSAPVSDRLSFPRANCRGDGDPSSMRTGLCGRDGGGDGAEDAVKVAEDTAASVDGNATCEVAEALET